ncbi:PssD/Cps14F family polysaccharide biosynthesis glycosyltransferase [Photobacterium rosenbergii]|uniref:PssD/Cps14F family polysaccharide biosynthesis glycosyltransferase n=1 Tax=Photobacterium rosenbergii TaxID=294936 RepID=A0ABU3ZPR1_9GAMM|nr:PssD/Cps14F family polysaccharide biosynthesis glycosyltransferase [Photobacterium rosenbergii]MDV5172113.1 PssD/Cps14F family polysaccharide biosynthesis glycosyltransferase [Photobacterium rosenbergii]
MSKVFIFVAGEGGHFSQFTRFYEKVQEDLVDCKIYLLTDHLHPNNNKALDGLNVVELGAIRAKSGFRFSDMFNHLYRAVSFYIKLRNFKEISMVSTGPGIAILPAILTRLLGGKVVHIETWSRFYSKSMTGKVMYFLANKFYVQNQSLLKLYKKAIYSGKL